MEYLVVLTAFTEDGQEWSQSFDWDLTEPPTPIEAVGALENLDVFSLIDHNFKTWKVDVDFYPDSGESTHFSIEGRKAK